MHDSDVATVPTRTVRSLQFGEIQVEPHHIFIFGEGILGFEELREFVLLTDDEMVPFRWLVSMDEPAICFPVLSPWHVEPEYEVGRDYVHGRDAAFVVVTLANEKGSMTANMKAPIILDTENQKGKQIIMSSDRYVTDRVIS